jgi:hypothetical protein
MLMQLQLPSTHGLRLKPGIADMRVMGERGDYSIAPKCSAEHAEESGVGTCTIILLRPRAHARSGNASPDRPLLLPCLLFAHPARLLIASPPCRACAAAQSIHTDAHRAAAAGE